MSKDKPLFWGSYKGRIIKYVLVEGASFWEDLRDLAGLNPKTMNKVLAELFQHEAIG